MTAEHLLSGGLVVSIVVVAWIGWFLSRRPRVRRGGYIHRR